MELVLDGEHFELVQKHLESGGELVLAGSDGCSITLVLKSKTVN